MKIKVRCLIDARLTSEGRSQTWLAREISYGLDKPVSPQLMSDWCNNRSTPSAGYIMRIAKVAGWRVEEFLEEVTN